MTDHATPACSAQREAEGASGGRSAWIGAGLLTLAVLLVFGQTVSFDFLMWDDEGYLLPHIRREQGLTPRSVAWSVTNRENGWLTPLPFLTLFADYEWAGLNPAGYHLTNVLIHWAATLALFDALRRMTGAALESLMAAALFALHPLHVEPVAWVSGRWELLCGAFFILGIWCYQAYCRRPSARWYLAVLGCFVAALFSKPMALTFPCVLLLLDYWPLRRLGPAAADGDAAVTWAGIRRALREKVPLLVVMLAYLVPALTAKATFMATRAMRPLTWSERLSNACETYAWGVVQLFWPSGLSFYYPHPAIQGGFPAWRVAAAAALLLLITVAALRTMRRWPFFSVGWFWYLGVYLPAVGVLQLGHHARADRYTYLPLIGLSLAVVWGVLELTRRVPRLGAARGAVYATAIVAMILASHRLTSTWRDNPTLFGTAVRVNPANFKAWSNLGLLAMREERYAEAEVCLRRALELAPGSYYHFILAKCLVLRGNDGEAEALLLRALEIRPHYPEARRLLARIHEERSDREETDTRVARKLRERDQ